MTATTIVTMTPRRWTLEGFHATDAPRAEKLACLSHLFPTKTIGRHRLANPLSAKRAMPAPVVRSVKPTRKRDGRAGPPEGYPKDPEKYADPANWKYPVHTPFHARAARRYFNKEPNRAKYSPEEQAYIDKRINEALEKFGVAIQVKGGEITEEAGTIQADVPLNKDIDAMSLDELLLVLLGTNRLASAKAIDPGLV